MRARMWAAIAATMGCSAATSAPPVLPAPVALPTPVFVAETVRVRDLGEIERSGRGPLVGVTVEPATGELWIATESGSVWRLGDGAATPVFAGATPISDIAALGQERFAVSAVGEGFVLDLALGMLLPWFCYEPEGWDPGGYGQPSRQQTRSLAYDPAEGRIYAQPQTVAEADPSLSFISQVAVFDRWSGADLAWLDLPDASFAAGGIAHLGGHRLLLGSGAQLSTFDVDLGTPVQGTDLADLGIVRIEGLAIDGRHLFVLDGATAQLFEIPRSRLVETR